MNWLAHLVLSEPNPRFRIGNLLPDLVRTSALSGLSADFLRGVQQHRQIDSFTDRHEIVRQSVRRVPANFRRFGGILVDMFYDHFLSREWSKFSAAPLPVFVDEIHASFESHRNEVPLEARVHLDRIREGNLLCSYGELSGLALALKRIGLRLRRPVPLSEAVPVLENNYSDFRADFHSFFPELLSHLAKDAKQQTQSALLNNP